AEPALVAELQVVRASDIRQRGVQGGEVPDQRVREAALPRGAGHPGKQAWDLAGLLQLLNHLPRGRAVVARREAVPGLIRAPAGLGQQPARNRRLPARVGLTGW